MVRLTRKRARRRARNLNLENIFAIVVDVVWWIVAALDGICGNVDGMLMGEMSENRTPEVWRSLNTHGFEMPLF